MPFPRGWHLPPRHRHPTEDGSFFYDVSSRPAGNKACFISHTAWSKSRFILERCFHPDSLNPEHSALCVGQSRTHLTCVVEGTGESPGGPWNQTQGLQGLPLASAPRTVATVRDKHLPVLIDSDFPHPSAPKRKSAS